MAATITYLQTAGDGTDLTVYTFSAQNFGTASSDRYIIAAVNSRANDGGARAISTITIGGVSASIAIQATSNGNCLGICLAAVPTGTSGDVVITFDSTMGNADIDLYSATSVGSATPTDSGSSTADPGTYDLDIAAGGIALALAKSDVGLGSCAWTGLTERYDGLDVNGNNRSGASDAFATIQTNLTVTGDFSVIAVRPLFVTASFPGAATGPANLKSYDTNVKSNIKSMNTNPIANVKSFDTNV